MKYFGWVFLFFIVVYILPLGSRPLEVFREYSFAESAREMVCSGDYVTPRLRGNVKLEIPSPAFYPAAKSIQLFGKNGFAVRFPGALSAGLAALFIWILIKQTLRDEKLAALSAVIYLSFAAVYLSGTMADPASLFAMLTIGSCGTLFITMQEEKINRRKVLNLILSGAFMGLAFLVGGFKGVVIPLLSGISYMVWDRKLRQMPLAFAGTLVIAALVAFPWVIAINRAEPGYWRFFINEMTLAEFCGREQSPWYWQIFAAVVGAFPAALLIPAAGVVGKDAWKGFLKQPLFRFAFCFLLLPLALFSFTRSWDVKGILPGFAPLALLIAAGVRVYFNSGGHHRSYNWMMTLWGAFLTLAGIGCAALRIWMKPEVLSDVLPVTLLFYPVMGIVLIFAGAVMIYSVTGNWRGRLYLFFFGIGLVLLFIPWFFRVNYAMPQAALKQIDEQLMRYPEKSLLLAETPELANAAAWEFENSSVATLAEYRAGKVKRPAGKIVIIEDGIDCLCEFVNVPAFELREAPVNVDPLRMLMLDLQTKPGK